MGNKMIFTVCVIQIAQLVSMVTTVSDDCFMKAKTVICKQTLPEQLPPNVTEVVVQDFAERNLTVNSFIHSSWASIVKLDISVNDKTATGNIRFGAGVFQPLHNLRNFGYHSPNLGSAHHPFAFSGLDRLTTLNLAECIWLDIIGLMTLLNRTEVLPALETLLLDNVNTLYSQHFNLDQTCVDVVYYKNIKTLSIAGTMSLVKNVEASNRQYALESLNVSQARFISTHRDMFPPDIRKQFVNSLRQLRTVDFSFYNLGDPFKKINGETITTDCTSMDDPIIHIGQTLENVYANGISVGSSIDNSTFNVSMCSFRMKVMHLQHNGIEKINCTMQWPIDIPLYELDLSYNQLQYVSPSSWHGLHSMKTLLLGSNRLWMMESMPEFSELFQGFPVLIHLNFANNKLSTLPNNIFQTNTRMEVLILSNNLLESITFETKQFSALQFLDISGNMISTIDANSRTRLDAILSTYNHMDTNAGTIDISENPIRCECDRAHSIMWLMNLYERNNVSVTCDFGNEILSMNSNTLDDVYYQCHKTTILIAVISTMIAGVVVVSLLVLLAHKMYTRHHVKDVVKRFIQEYRQGRIPESYIAMLSYSSQDGDFVLENIYPVLEKHLRERVKLSRDIVCIDDKHFVPGRPIVEEMMGHIRDSCVTVCVVSRSFCERTWCRREVEEAYERGKPIILIFLQEVDRALMPAHLCDIFDRYTRVKFETDDEGHPQLKPSWPLLCQSILELASQKQACSRSIYRRNSKIELVYNETCD